MTNLATIMGEETPLFADEFTFSCDLDHAKNNNTAVSPQPLCGKASELITLINGRNSVASIGASFSYIDNRVRIESGTLLAKKPNSINSDWKVKQCAGDELLNSHIEPFFKFIGAKRITQQKIALLDCVLANLLSAYNTHSQLLYSRNKSHKDTKSLIQITDYLEHCELIVNVIGKNNEFQGNSSWMLPTQKLHAQFESSKAKVELKKDDSCVVIRDADGKEKSLHRVKTRQALKLKEASNPIQDYNMLWLNHEATVGGRWLVPYCRRIFNESLDFGGRYYGASHLVLPKAERQMISIDGEATIEPDFKALHFCLLYAQAGIQLNPLENDPYTVAGFDRKTVKLACLVLLNSENLGHFKANITKSGNPEIKKAMAQYKADLKLFLMRSSKGLPCDEPIKPKVSQGFIEGMPDHIKGEDLFAALMEKHKEIAHLFGREKIGVTLQNIDSQIMSKTIQQLAALNIPILPVHDSAICKVRDLDTVTNAMRLAYKAVTGFDGCVTVD